MMENGRWKMEENKNDTGNKRQIIKGAERRGLSAVFSCCMILFLMSVIFHLPSAIASDKWPGVDESVVEKYAKEHGRETREPFINTDQGDLLLFVFLLAGTVGGFAAGYYWRMLMAERVPDVKGKAEKTTK